MPLIQTELPGRKDLLNSLLRHITCLPDAQEAFELLDTVRRLEGITCEEASELMSLYWANA